MANEYLKRTPTSTGNRKVFTWSGWVKLNRPSFTSNYVIFCAGTNGSNNVSALEYGNSNNFRFYDYGGSYTFQYLTERKFRDISGWMHILASVDTTQGTGAERVNLYINGVKLTGYSTETDPTINAECAHFNNTSPHYLGRLADQTSYPAHEYTDVFFVDGQALTPDVFGFYKEGKGYISAGSTQATDFRPGQWVPKKPSVIKNTINNNGGFGVNGFYLPMNDSSNFGADFHCDPNSIITLKGEDLPQPQNGAPTTTDAYVSQLRTDPYAANLVLAVPGITGAPGVAYTDFSTNIKGSGTNKTLTANGNAGVAVTASYYGSALSFDGNGDYFTHASNSDFQFGTGDFTVEFWMKRTDSGTNVGLLDTRTTNTDGNGWFIRFTAATTIQLVDNATQYASLTHSSDWNHIAFVRDSNLITGYVNGVAGGITTDVSTNFSSSNFLLGGFVDTQASPNAYGGYIQDLRIYKGVAKYKGGFDVPKPYTPVGIGTWRAVPDTTANNFATLNPLANAVAGTLSNGNLQVQPTGTNDKHVFSTFGFNSGKWYAEVRDVDQQARGNILVSDANHNATTTGTNNISVQMWDGTVATSGTDNGNLSAFSTGDILAIAYDADIGSVWLAKNGAVDTSGTAIATGISTNPERDYRFSYRETGGTQTTTNWNFGQNPTFSGQVSAGATERNADSNGKGEFRYAPPTGFLALCEDNLPTPAIADPGDYFKTVLYTGDGNVGRSIDGVGFQPDLVWIKKRNGSERNLLVDSVRGVDKGLSSDLPNPEFSSNTVALQSFDDNGFTLGSGGYVNESSSFNYVAWCWKIGAGTTSVNTDGTIDSVVSVNQDAGVSIVTYTSTGSNTATETVGHGLNKTPNMIILKNRSATVNWRVYHSGINDAGKNSVTLNSTEAAYVFWPSVGSDTFGLANSTTTGQAAGTGNQDIVAYCWTEIEGFSKFGSYVGNGNADGPFVYLGFKPAWIMFKRSDTTGGWVIKDSSRKSTNPNNYDLFANTSVVESDVFDCDFLSNGFKIRDTTANNSGGTYIFAAFAESPFTTANAK